MGALCSGGVLSSSPGIGGGYRLAREPEEIALIHVIRLIDGERSLPQCLLHSARPCSDDDPCSAHATWSGVRGRYVAFLESITIAAISQTPGAKRLGADASPCALTDREKTKKDPG